VSAPAQLQEPAKDDLQAWAKWVAAGAPPLSEHTRERLRSLLAAAARVDPNPATVRRGTA
jgi:hypothetical protein